jgi:hypothetical protein
MEIGWFRGLKVGRFRGLKVGRFRGLKVGRFEGLKKFVSLRIKQTPKHPNLPTPK